MNQIRCSANNSKGKNFDIKNVLMLLSIFTAIIIVWYLIIKFGIIPFLGVFKKILNGI